MLTVVAYSYHKRIIQMPLGLHLFEEGSDSLVDKPYRPSEEIMALDEVDLRELGAVLVLIKEITRVLEGVFCLGLAIEAAISASTNALGIPKL